MSSYAPVLDTSFLPALAPYGRKRKVMPEVPIDDVAPIARQTTNVQPLDLAPRRDVIEPERAPSALYAGEGDFNFAPQNAPRALQSPVVGVGPMADVRREGLESTNPRIRQSALSDIYGAPIAETLVPGEKAQALAAEQARDVSPKQQGFWDKAWHVLRTAGKGALLGGARFGLGGAIGGGFIGGFAPGLADRAWQQQVTLPPLEAQAEEERAQQGARYQRLASAAGQAGLLPSGEMTEAAKERRATLDNQNYWKGKADEDRDASRDISERRLKGYLDTQQSKLGVADRKQRLAEANIWLKNVAPYGRINDADRAAFTAKYGIELPDGFDPQRHQLFDDGQGVRIVGMATGDARTLPGVASPKGEQLRIAGENAATNAQRANNDTTRTNRPKTYYEPGGGTVTTVDPNTGKVTGTSQTTPRPQTKRGGNPWRKPAETPPTASDPRIGKKFKDKQGNIVIVDEIGPDGQPSKWHAQ